MVTNKEINKTNLSLIEIASKWKFSENVYYKFQCTINAYLINVMQRKHVIAFNKNKVQY